VPVPPLIPFQFKCYLCWLRRRRPQRISYTPPAPPPSRRGIIIELAMELQRVLSFMVLAGIQKCFCLPILFSLGRI
jgi:hypothetical protein